MMITTIAIGMMLVALYTLIDQAARKAELRAEALDCRLAEVEAKIFALEAKAEALDRLEA